jgi:hypothetical protein
MSERKCHEDEEQWLMLILHHILLDDQDKGDGSGQGI